ncbi:MAG: sensor histidine kinase [Phormidesmis sp. RL_2_1]|nr:sensor histidine kinase [Phormidesmis sp. RL_2_1]
MPAALQKSLPEPELTTGSRQPLGVHSTVADLPLYRFSVSADCPIQGLVAHFETYLDLPGVIIVTANGHAHGTVTVLSRQQFLECFLQLGHTSLFKNGPIRLVLGQATHSSLSLASDTSILLGAQQALKRSIDQQAVPLLIKDASGYQLLDAHVLNVAHWQIRGLEIQSRYERLQLQLLQSEKMAALGRLVDGVAHEILDPVSFIWGNLGYISNYAQQQQALIAAYEAALPEPPAEIVQLKEDIEFDYLSSDLPAAIKSAKGGAHRLKQLATSLQNFCHIDEVHPRPADLNTLLDSTLRLLRSHLANPIKIERCYGTLPPVLCFSGQLSQVFMNIFTNAIDVLLTQAQIAQSQYSQADSPALNNPAEPTYQVPQIIPQITVTTCVRAAQFAPEARAHACRWVSIIISDNGPGLPPALKAQIMESFAANSHTRKKTGLAMSYQIITAKHGGRFWMRSFHASEDMCDRPEKTPTGTEFEILLPLTTAE